MFARILHFLPSDLSRNPPDTFSVGLPDEDNIYEWDIMLMGPEVGFGTGGRGGGGGAPLGPLNPS